MPSRNTRKDDVQDMYYHVYNRGASKQIIFLDEQDYSYFISMFVRYLSKKSAIAQAGTVYAHYYDQVELVTFCLMPNHFHLLMYQLQENGLSNFMKSLTGSYSQYFNLRYKRSGPTFEEGTAEGCR